MLNVLVPQVVLDRSRIVAVVREFVPAAVAEHVGMDRKAESRLLPRPGEELPEPRRRERAAPLARKYIGSVGRPFPLQFPQGPEFRPPQGMDARRPPLHPVDVEHSPREVHLIPAQRDEFRHPQAVPVREEDEGGVAVAVAPPPLRRLHQEFHLALGEVFAAAAVAVRYPFRRAGGSDCPIYSGWRLLGGYRVHAGVVGHRRGLLSREGA